MKTLFLIVLISFALYGISWFVRFEVDPRNVCVPHPTKAKMWLCQPGDFEFERGIWERSAPMVWNTRGERFEMQEEVKAKKPPAKRLSRPSSGDDSGGYNHTFGDE